MNLAQIMQRELIKVKPGLIRDAVVDILGLIGDREYRKMEKLGHKLGIPVPGFHCRRQIFLDGKETFDSGILRAHTVNRNYYNMMFSQGACKDLSDATSFGTGFLSVKETSGTVDGSIRMGIMMADGATQSADVRASGEGILAPAGIITNGIVFGTSSAAESFEGFALGTPIVNGNGAGQFDYAQSDLHVVTNATLTLKDTLIRDANNNSGGSITVEEAAIYVGADIDGTQSPIMITRDLTGGDAVGNTAQYRYTYEITLVFPS